MELLLLFLAAEVAAVALQQKARQRIVEKWKEGSLSQAELQYLKQAKWFRKLVWRPTQRPVSGSKKNN